MERHTPYHEKDLPIVDRIEFRLITDEQARIAAIRSGEVHLTTLKDPRTAKIVEADPNIVMHKTGTMLREGTPVNMQREPLGDIRVRQAISYALNRQEMVDTILGGEGSVTGVFPPLEKEWALPMTKLPLLVPRPREGEGAAEGRTGKDSVSFSVPRPLRRALPLRLRPRR